MHYSASMSRNSYGISHVHVLLGTHLWMDTREVCVILAHTCGIRDIHSLGCKLLEGQSATNLDLEGQKCHEAPTAGIAGARFMTPFDTEACTVVRLVADSTCICRTRHVLALA